MKLSITVCEEITVRELLHLHESNHSVYRTSHAGNWSLYKLFLSELGLPDCIWDVTCIHRDVNNQPAFKIIDGHKVQLLAEPLIEPNGNTKQLTPYQRLSGSDITLSNFHVEPLRKLFGDNVITSQSKLLLDYKEELFKVFDVIQNHMPSKLGRYVLPCGCMVVLTSDFEASCMHGSIQVRRNDLAISAIETLGELINLVWNPIGYKPKGGVLYSLELVAVSFYLWSFWRFGSKPIYQLSGPDLISYGVTADFHDRLSRVLRVIEKHVPELVPKNINVHIVPTVLFRFGYLQNDKHADLSLYSQHDMVKNGTRMKIIEEYLDIPFSAMKSLVLR